MKIAFLIYHDVLEDRVEKILGDLKIDAYTKWEDATGKFEGADPLLGTRTFPGRETVRLIAFPEEGIISKLTADLEDFNSKAVKAIDKIRMFLMPLEKIV